MCVCHSELVLLLVSYRCNTGLVYSGSRKTMTTRFSVSGGVDRWWEVGWVGW